MSNRSRLKLILCEGCHGDLLFLEVHHGIISVPKVHTLWTARTMASDKVVEVLVAHHSGVVYLEWGKDRSIGVTRWEFLYYYKPMEVGIGEIAIH